jgi:hypothetical protein
MAGVHPKVVQTIMRHSTITLTMDTYANLFKGQEADAVAKIRDMMISNQPEVIRATGTDDLGILEDGGEQSAAHAQRTARETGQSVATPCDQPAQPPILQISQNPDKTGASCDPVPSATMPCINTAPLAQLAERLTLNQ